MKFLGVGPKKKPNLKVIYCISFALDGIMFCWHLLNWILHRKVVNTNNQCMSLQTMYGFHKFWGEPNRFITRVLHGPHPIATLAPGQNQDHHASAVCEVGLTRITMFVRQVCWILISCCVCPPFYICKHSISICTKFFWWSNVWTKFLKKQQFTVTILGIFSLSLAATWHSVRSSSPKKQPITGSCLTNFYIWGFSKVDCSRVESNWTKLIGIFVKYIYVYVSKAV